MDATAARLPVRTSTSPMTGHPTPSPSQTQGSSGWKMHEFGAKPRVYYLNIPKKFVAGTVYAPVEKEVIIGATCTLSGNGSRKLTATTDGFGDFWFEGLEVGTYSLKIEAEGFAAKTIDSISTEQDVNLGDIPLSE